MWLAIEECIWLNRLFPLAGVLLRISKYDIGDAFCKKDCRISNAITGLGLVSNTDNQISILLKEGFSIYI